MVEGEEIEGEQGASCNHCQPFSFDDFRQLQPSPCDRRSPPLVVVHVLDVRSLLPDSMKPRHFGPSVFQESSSPGLRECECAGGHSLWGGGHAMDLSEQAPPCSRSGLLSSPHTPCEAWRDHHTECDGYTPAWLRHARAPGSHTKYSRALARERLAHSGRAEPRSTLASLRPTRSLRCRFEDGAFSSPRSGERAYGSNSRGGPHFGDDAGDVGVA